MKNSAFISFFNPLIKAISPIGTTQSVGGERNLTFFIASKILSACSLEILFGNALDKIPDWSQTSWADFAPTLENSSWKNYFNVLVFVAWSIFINIPNSIPLGCGFISLGSGGSLSIALAKIIWSALGLV